MIVQQKKLEAAFPETARALVLLIGLAGYMLFETPNESAILWSAPTVEARCASCP
jgi:hypothetical protein